MAIFYRIIDYSAIILELLLMLLEIILIQRLLISLFELTIIVRLIPLFILIRIDAILIGVYK
jgi:hypothetical protein